MHNNSLTLIVDMLSGTPLWVWFILIYLVFVGIKATGSRIVYLPKLFIIPGVLIALNFGNYHFKNGWMLTNYLVCFCIGFSIGFYFAYKTKIKILKNLRSIELPGNYQTLILLMLFFSIKYIFGFLTAAHPDIANEYHYLALGIYGLFSGYFLGRAFAYLKKYNIAGS